MTDGVRLNGTDGDVIAVARAAARVIRPDRDARRALFPQLVGLHHDRRRLLASESNPPPPGRSTSARLRSAIWGALLGSGLVAALTAAVMLGPPGRKNAYSSADLAMAVAVPAATIAIPLLLLVLFLPVPRGEAARYGTVTTVTVAVVVAGILVFRFLVGTGDSRGFSPEQVAAWLRLTAVILLVLVALSWRLDVARRRGAGDTAPRPGVVPGTARHLRRTAERLADIRSDRTAEARSDWSRRLARLEKTGVDPGTVEQARTMSPAAWLTWTFYDGEIDVTDVLPKS